VYMSARRQSVISVDHLSMFYRFVAVFVLNWRCCYRHVRHSGVVVCGGGRGEGAIRFKEGFEFYVSLFIF
jgi:hypothetical protein